MTTTPLKVLLWITTTTILSYALDLPISCPRLRMGSIPADHLFHKKTKPVIIGHRGQPLRYQENTLDGFKSVEKMGADGYELDIYKTKDDKLVVFHDDDTMRMTGVKKLIWESTYEELRQLNITTKVRRGNRVYTFDKPRKIPLLEAVLNATKHTNLLHYLEMKPSEPQRGDDDLTEKTGKMVAQMVTRMGLQRRAILVSFDFRKVHRVKKENPELTVGTLFTTWYADVFDKPTKMLVKAFPKYEQCWKDAPSNKLDWFKFALQSGLVFKLSGSTSFDSNLDLYSDIRYSNDTVATIRKNYGASTSTGFYTMYSMADDELEHFKAEIKLVKLLTEGGAERIITDDVPRVKKFLKKMNMNTISYISENGTGSSNNLIATNVLILGLLVVVFLY